MSLKRVCDLCGGELSRMSNIYTYKVIFEKSWVWIGGRTTEKCDVCWDCQRKLVQILKEKRNHEEIQSTNLTSR